MSRTVKIGLGVLAGLVVVATIAFALLWSNLAGIVRAAVEQAGTEVTGTEVRLGDVDISLTDGMGTLSGFRVVNPEGFERDDAFRFDSVTVHLDLDSIASDPVIVKEVVVDGPAIVYELAETGSNIDRIKANVSDYSRKHGDSGAGKSGGSKAGGGGSAAKAEAKSEEGPNIIIEKLTLVNGTVSVRASDFTSRKLSVPLPTLNMRDIGKKEGGAEPAEIAEAIMSEITGSVTRTVSDIDLGELLGDAGDEAKALLDSVGKGAGSVSEGIGEKADKVGSSLKKLFGN